jgi:hypothetical protein
MLAILSAAAWAAPEAKKDGSGLVLGGAVDVRAGAWPETGDTGLALRQVEGDLFLGNGGVGVRVDLDVAASFTAHSATWYSASPEWAAVQWRSKGVQADAGIFPAPWRIEAVDPWDNVLSSFSLVSMVLPGQMAGADVGLGSRTMSARAVGGLELGALDLSHPDDLAARLLLGGIGEVDSDVVDLRGGAWVTEAGVGAQLGANVDAKAVAVLGEMVMAGGQVFGGQLQVTGTPHAMVSPVARGEVVQGLGWGVEGGVCVTLIRVVKVKAEAGWQRDAPAIYVEGSIASPWP